MELSRPGPAPSPAEAAPFPIDASGPAAASPSAPPATWRGPPGLIGAAAAVLIAVAWTAAFGLADREQQADLEVAQRQISNLALALDRHTNFLLRVADRATIRLKEAMEQRDLARARRQLAQLQDRYETQLAFAALVGPDGNVVAGSSDSAIGLNVADRDHFKAHLRSDGGHPYIGDRIEAQVANKGAVTVSRRVNGPNGSFGGVAVAGIDLDALDEFFREFAIGSEGSIYLMRLDGMVVVRRSASSNRRGHTDPPAFIPPTPAPKAPAHGTLVTTSRLDGSQHITSYRKLRQYPLIVAVTESEQEVFAGTRRTQAGIYTGAAFFTLLVLFGSLLGCRLALREQRNAAALRASEARFRTIFEQAPLGITVSDYERRYLHANDAFCRMLGRTRDQVIGHAGEEFLLPEDFHRSRAIRERFFLGEVPTYSLEMRYRRPDGSIVWTRRTSAPLYDAGGRIHQVLRTVEDITERREMEALLRLHVEATQAVASADSFESGIAAAVRLICKDAGWEIGEAWLPSPDGSRLVWLDSAFCSSIENIEPFRAASVGYWHAKGERMTGRVWATGKAEWRRLADNPAPAPRRAHLVEGLLQAHCCIPVAIGNDVVGVLSFHTREQRPEDPRLLDAACSITAQLSELFQRKQIEDELRLQSQILENLAEGVHLTRSGDGVIVFANPALETMFGYERGSLIGRHASILYVAEYPAFDDASGPLAATVRDSGTWDGTVWNVRKDGSLLWCSVRVSRFVHPLHGNVWISLHQDVTERKRAEQELQRSAALAHLLEGLARSVNEAPTPALAIQACLERICEYGRWTLGHFTLMPGRELGANPYTSCWHVPQDPERYAEVMRESGNLLNARIDPAGKFAAQALRERKPIWISDLARVRGLSRLQFAVRAGLRTAFGFPVFVGEEAAAFVEFFAPDVRDEDATLMAAGNGIAAQLERLIERDRAFRANAELAAIVKTATVAIFTRTLEGTILSWNPGAERMLGYSAEEALGRPTTFTLPPGHPAQLERNNETLLHGEVVARESSRLTKDGRVIDVLTSHSPIRDGAGNIIGASVILQDISALKSARAIVKESEERFRAAFEQASVGMSLRKLEAGGRWLRVNQKLCDLLGYTREELLAFPPVEINLPEEREISEAYGARLVRGELAAYSREKRYLRKDGHLLWGRVTVSALRGADGRPSERFAIVEDITEQKRTEQAFRESEQRLRAFLSNSAVIAWMKDEDGRYLFLSDNYQRRLQPWIEDWKGKTDFDMWPREIAEELRRNDLAVLEGGRAIEVIEQTLNPDDHESWWLTNKFVFQDAAGRRYVGGLGVDVTERKHLEGERQRLAAIVASSNDAILSRTQDGTLLSWNAAAERLFGWSAQEAVGKSVRLIVPPERRGTLRPFVEQAWAGEWVEPIETTYIRKDGTRFPTLVTLSPIKDEYDRTSAISVTIRDNTYRKQTERDLERKTALAQLLESLARAANEATTPGEAMQLCLARICEHGEWVLGRLGMYGPGEVGFVPGHSEWYEKHPGHYAQFKMASLDDRNFSHSGRFLTAVLRENKPVWLDDIPRRGTGRHRIAAACGLGSAFAFPVSVRGNVVAFLEFYAEGTRPADPLLMDASTSVGAMLARLIERNQAAAERERLAAIVETSAEAVWSRAADHTLLSWNTAAERLFGWERDEVIGQRGNFLVPPEQLPERELIPDRLAHGEETVILETVRLRKDGTPIDIELRASAVRDQSGNVVWTAFIAHDITERKIAEKALRDYSQRLQVLSRRLIDAQERERAVIARELHDQTGQVLSVLKLTLQIARRDARARQVAPHLDEALQHIDTALQQVRTLSYSLRPPQLDDLGLAAALRNYADRIASAASMTVHYAMQAPPGLAGQAAIACFRVAQEAITNVVRHAGAKTMWIALACEDELRLEVRDDGKGCDMLKVRRRALRGDSMGIVNMEERTLLGGGSIDIDSSPGNGTVVRASFPFRAEEPAQTGEGT